MPGRTSQSAWICPHCGRPGSQLALGWYAMGEFCVACYVGTVLHFIERDVRVVPPDTWFAAGECPCCQQYGTLLIARWVGSGELCVVCDECHLFGHPDRNDWEDGEFDTFEIAHPEQIDAAGWRRYCRSRCAHDADCFSSSSISLQQVRAIDRSNVESHSAPYYLPPVWHVCGACAPCRNAQSRVIAKLRGEGVLCAVCPRCLRYSRTPDGPDDEGELGKFAVPAEDLIDRAGWRTHCEGRADFPADWFDAGGSKSAFDAKRAAEAAGAEAMAEQLRAAWPGTDPRNWPSARRPWTQHWS